MNGYKKMEKIMVDFAPTFITPLVEKKLKNKDFHSAQTEIEFVIFNGFSEISNSLNKLNLIETFVNIEPPSHENINYSNYLTYHVHNYLQEMFILRERLKTYSNNIKKRYSKVLDKGNLENIVTLLMQIITDFFGAITREGAKGIRNSHVHIKEFKDVELNWLSSTTFLSTFDAEFKIQSKIAYESAKNKWYKVIKDNNLEVVKLLDIYFDTIYQIISVDDKIVLPKDYTKAFNKTLKKI